MPPGRRLAATLALAGVAALAAFAAREARAHSTSEAYLTLDVPAGSAAVSARLDIALADLDEAVGLDTDGNGEITWGELRSREAAVVAYATARVALHADEQTCALRTAGDTQVVEHGGRGFVVLPLVAACPQAPRALALDYRLFADVNPTHRGLLKLQAGGAVRSAVLDPAAAAPQRFELAEAGAWRTFVAYVGQGVWHIWIGLDHILFLVALLLPSVLWRDRARWLPAAHLRGVAWDVLKVVTGFTVAHSITLTLATLGWLAPPARPVESLIAASVALAAVNNVWPLIGGRRWLVAFGFGLVHGFGFAGALAELGLPQGALALSLFGFNVGVEIGQLAIVLVFLPLAFALRRTRFYRGAVLVGGSALIALLALAWFVERAFALELFGG